MTIFRRASRLKWQVWGRFNIKYTISPPHRSINHRNYTDWESVPLLNNKAKAKMKFNNIILKNLAEILQHHSCQLGDQLAKSSDLSNHLSNLTTFSGDVGDFSAALKTAVEQHIIIWEGCKHFFTVTLKHALLLFASSSYNPGKKCKDQKIKEAVLSLMIKGQLELWIKVTCCLTFPLQWVCQPPLNLKKTLFTTASSPLVSINLKLRWQIEQEIQNTMR